MPTDWADKVRAAITNLETKTDRVLEPDVAPGFTAAWKKARGLP
jgi:hypothetical protein